MEHLSTFGLTRDPFANEPQLDLFFEGQSAREVGARLRRALQQSKGLVLVTGPGGVGKTMLVRQLLDSLEEDVFEACLLVPVPGVSDFAWVLDRLARQLGVEAPAKERAALLAEVYERLAMVREEGRQAVLILDEAQVLAEQAMLRELRGLLNLEYEDRRLLTVVLVGLPSLTSALASESALADRIDVPLRLAGLGADEAGRYVSHRIRAAGGNPAIVESGAVAALVKWGGGVPRTLNRLADAALFEAHLAGRVSATAGDVERAAAELGLVPEGSSERDLEREAARPAEAPPAARRAAGEAPRRATDPMRRTTTTPPSLPPMPSAAPARDLDAIFEADEAAIELEEVVASGTDPLRASAGATVALIGDATLLEDAFAPAADATVALFADSADFGRRPSRAANAENSSGDLDDLFADLVKE